MPWILEPSYATNQPEWRYINEVPPPIGFRNADFIPSAEDMRRPLLIELLPQSRDPNDFAAAPGANANVIVSQRFKECVAAFEPSLHNFMPVVVSRPGGELCPDPFYLLKLGELLDDSIDLEQSTLAVNQRMNRYYPTKIPPNIMWKASKVRGRHLWADRKLLSILAVSDELFALFKANNIRGFVSKESRIDGIL